MIKLDDGQLAYNNAGIGSEVVYNTVSTPRGGQYQLVLADGSKVWLNAASTLRFPTSFVGKERKVELEGEGYFEVAKNAAMPFKVDVDGKGEVEVLGTHFNINSYSNEPAINTTLIEGSVKVTGNLSGKTQNLNPGEQARINAAGQVTLNRNINVDEIIAWKEGNFNFNSAGIEYIMRNVSRWYDLDVVYQGVPSKETFSGIVSRNSNLSEVLMIIKQAGIKFKIEGKKITVM